MSPPETRREVLWVDLSDDPQAIAAYEALHRAGMVWPDVCEAIRADGVVAMTIHRFDVHLVMILDIDDRQMRAPSPEILARADAWEQLVAQYRAQSSDGRPGDWQPMQEIFSLSEQGHLAQAEEAHRVD